MRSAQRRLDATGRKRKIDPNSAPNANKILVILCYTTDHTPGSSKWNALNGGDSAAVEKTKQRESYDVLVKQVILVSETMSLCSHVSLFDAALQTNLI